MKKIQLLTILLAGILSIWTPVMAEETGTDAPAAAGETNPGPGLPDEKLPPLPQEVKKDVEVLAIFVNSKAQPMPVSRELPENVPGRPGEEAEPEYLDTIWLYFSDNTFDQYAEVDGQYVLFSKGTYVLDGSFDGEGTLTINRTEKYSPDEKAPAEYSSLHDYELDELRELGFTQVGESGITAVFGDTRREEFTDEDGITRYLDTFWLFKEDGSFKQYVVMDREVVLFSSGTYGFDSIGDFHFPFEDEDHGTITLKWDYSLDKDAKLEKTCDLNSLGMRCLFEKYEELPRPGDEEPPAEE